MTAPPGSLAAISPGPTRWWASEHPGDVARFTPPCVWAGEIDGVTVNATLCEMIADAAFDRVRTLLGWEAQSAGIETALRVFSG